VISNTKHVSVSGVSGFTCLLFHLRCYKNRCVSKIASNLVAVVGVLLEEEDDIVQRQLQMFTQCCYNVPPLPLPPLMIASLMR